MAPRLQTVFNNFKLSKSVSVTGVRDGYVGFGMSNSNPIKYYVTNVNKSKIFVFDDDWKYVSEKLSFTNVHYISLVGNYFFITGDENVWKTDIQLNVLITYNSAGSNLKYRGLYYNSTNDLIYVTVYSAKEIRVFNLDLTLNDTIPTSSYYPWSINGFNNLLYVGSQNGKMLIVENKIIIKTFDGCDQKNYKINSMLFDDSIANRMGIACDDEEFYLYHTNGNNLNKDIKFASSPYFIGFDSKSRLVIVTESQIYLYD